MRRAPDGRATGDQLHRTAHHEFPALERPGLLLPLPQLPSQVAAAVAPTDKMTRACTLRDVFPNLRHPSIIVLLSQLPSQAAAAIASIRWHRDYVIFPALECPGLLLLLPQLSSQVAAAAAPTDRIAGTWRLCKADRQQSDTRRIPELAAIVAPAGGWQAHDRHVPADRQ